MLTHHGAVSPYSIDPTGLRVTASGNGKRSWLTFKVWGEERQGLCLGTYWQRQKAGEVLLKEIYHI